MPDRAVAPFARGRTFFHGKTVDASDLPGRAVLGQMHVFQDTDPSDETKHRSNGDVVAIAVRNVSGISLLPKRIVTFKADAIGKEVDGYCEVINERVAGIVDDHLPSAGCPDDDICWIIVKGPCLAITSYVNMAAALVVNDPVHAKAAASSTAGTAAAGGRFNRLAEGALTGDAGLLIVNSVIGYGMTARAVGDTNTDTLIDVRLR